MARLQLVFVALAWVAVLAAVVRRRVRGYPHRRWVTAFETLRGWQEEASTPSRPRATIPG